VNDVLSKFVVSHPRDFFSLLSLSHSIARSPFSAHSLRQQYPPDSVPVLVRPTIEMRARGMPNRKKNVKKKYVRHTLKKTNSPGLPFSTSAKNKQTKIK
jgi:hypothetical protein